VNRTGCRFPALIVLSLAALTGLITIAPAVAAPSAEQSVSARQRGCEKLAGRLYLLTELGKKTAPYYPGANLVVTPICFDFTGDHRRDVVLAIHAGGTSGALNWAAFRRTRQSRGPLRRRFRLVAEPNSGPRTELERRRRLVLVKTPIWRRSDPNADPTGGETHRLYRIGWNRVKLVRQWHVAHNRND